MLNYALDDFFASLFDFGIELSAVFVFSLAIFLCYKLFCKHCRRGRKEKADADVENERGENLHLRQIYRRGVVLPLHIEYDDDSVNTLLLYTTAGSRPRPQLPVRDIPWKSTLELIINGNKMTLSNPDPTILLSTFLRENLCLTGTKLG